MKLYLVRHGEAVNVLESSQRPLSERGKLEVQVVAQFIARQHLSVPHVYHSDKLRAVETAHILAQAMTPAVNPEILPGLQPDDPVKPIATYCNHWQQDVMLVGHLPFMPKLVSELCFEKEHQLFIDFQTAGMVCLERMAAFQWSIQWMIAPSLLDYSTQC